MLYYALRRIRHQRRFRRFDISRFSISIQSAMPAQDTWCLTRYHFIVTLRFLHFEMLRAAFAFSLPLSLWWYFLFFFFFWFLLLHIISSITSSLLLLFILWRAHFHIKRVMEMWWCRFLRLPPCLLPMITADINIAISPSSAFMMLRVIWCFVSAARRRDGYLHDDIYSSLSAQHIDCLSGMLEYDYCSASHITPS